MNKKSFQVSIPRQNLFFHGSVRRNSQKELTAGKLRKQEIIAENEIRKREVNRRQKSGIQHEEFGQQIFGGIKNVISSEQEDEKSSQDSRYKELLPVENHTNEIRNFDANGQIPSWFDAKAYYRLNQDLSARFAFDENILWEHYINHGKFENRKFVERLSQKRNINQKRNFNFFGGNSIEQKKNEWFRVRSLSYNNLEKRFKNLKFPTHKNPTLSILLITFNRSDCTINCLESLYDLRKEVDFEVIIWDNASTDKTTEYLTYVEGITVISCKENLHFLRAVNNIAPMANGKYTLLLNNDSQVYPGSLKAAIKTFSKFKNVGSVGAMTIFRDSQKLQEAGSGILNFSPMGFGRDDVPTLCKYNYARPVVYCSGSFLMLNTEVFRKLGYLDVRYAPAYFEETDLSIRLIKAGYLNYYQPKCRIYHEEGASKSKQYDPSELMKMNSDVFRRTHEAFLMKLTRNVELFHIYRPIHECRNLLWIENELPLKSKGSGYPRMHSILKYLASTGWFITYFAYWSNENIIQENLENLPEGVEFRCDNWVDLFNKRAGFYKGIAVSRVHVFKSVSAQIEVIAKRHKIPIIYDMETLTSDREIMKKNINPKSKIQITLQEEVSCANKADVVICVSGLEAEKLKASGTRSELCIFGHNLKNKSKGSIAFDNRFGFLFVGFLGIQDCPNSDSIIWFLNFVWPIIKKELPTAFLNIVGDCCKELKKYLENMEDSSINIRGKISNNDLALLYQQSRVFIAPTRLFSGIPYKIHHAATWGLPFVCSTALLKNMHWENEFESAVENATPLNFARSCLRLHSDGVLWEKERKKIFDLIESENSASSLENLTNRMLHHMATKNRK